MPLSDYFYFTCKAGKCKGAFRVREIPNNAGMCSYRPVVEPVPSGAIPIVLDQLKNILPSSHYTNSPEQIAQALLLDQFKDVPPDGSFMIQLMPAVYYRPLPDASADDLKHAFQGNFLRKPNFRKLQKFDGDTELKAIRSDWEAQSTRELWSPYIYWAIQIGSFLLFLWPMAVVTKRYQVRILAYFSGKTQRPGVAGYLLAQFALFILAFLLALFSIGMWLAATLAALIFPIILLFEIVQFCLYALLRHIKRKRNAT